MSQIISQAYFHIVTGFDESQMQEHKISTLNSNQFPNHNSPPCRNYKIPAQKNYNFKPDSRIIYWARLKSPRANQYRKWKNNDFAAYFDDNFHANFHAYFHANFKPIYPAYFVTISSLQESHTQKCSFQLQA